MLDVQVAKTRYVMIKNKSEKIMRVGVIGADQYGRGFGARAHVPGVQAAPNVAPVTGTPERGLELFLSGPSWRGD